MASQSRFDTEVDDRELWRQYINEPDGPDYLRQDTSSTRYYPKLRHAAPRAPSPSDLTGQRFPKNEDEIAVDAIRFDQRSLLRDHTIAELESMGCWGLEDARPNNLTYPIHPLYQRGNWVQMKRLRIGNGYSGNWDAQNKIVWEAIEPAIRLASAYLINQHLWPWLNGLLYGQWRKIEAKDLEPHPLPDWIMKEMKDGTELTSGYENFVQYGGYEFKGRLEETDKLTQDKNLRRIESVLGNITCNFEFEGPSTYGHTFNQELYGPSRISIGQYASLPLLDKKLTVSERLVQEALWATTLVHETMHALTHSIRQIRPDIPNFIPDQVIRERQGVGGAEGMSIEPEPFFEDEEATEIGRSWEKLAFGGFTDSIQDPRLSTGSCPLLVHTITDWPSFCEFPPWKPSLASHERHRHPERFGPDSRCATFPIPTRYNEWIGQQGFWDVNVEAYGREALRVPRICGRQYAPNGSHLKVYGRDAEYWVPGHEIRKARWLPPPPPLYADQATQWLYQANRLTRQQAIDTILYNQRDEERVKSKIRRWFRTRKKMDAAIEAYQKSKIIDAHKILTTIEETDSYKYNLLRSVFYYSLYSRNPNEEIRESGRIFGKAAKESFLAWIKAEASWITPKNKGAYYNEPNKLDPLYQRIADILFVSAHLDPKGVNILKKHPSGLRRWRDEIEGAVREMDRKGGGLRNLARKIIKSQRQLPVFDLRETRPAPPTRYF